jgi:hypothetical protein
MMTIGPLATGSEITPYFCLSFKEVKVRGGKAPYADNALKVMPIVPSPATFYDHERA